MLFSAKFGSYGYTANQFRYTMRKIISAALLVGGILLLYFGYQEYQSLQSEVDQLFGGSGSDKAIWMMVGGGAATVGGLMGLLRDKMT